MIAPARDAMVVLAATVKVSVVLPLPLVGDTMSQLLSLVAVQAQPALVLTEKVPDDPPANTDTAVGASENVQEDVDVVCVTVTVRPAIVSVAVRLLPVVFADAV
jgi:hypothetical protein